MLLRNLNYLQLFWLIFSPRKGNCYFKKNIKTNNFKIGDL